MTAYITAPVLRSALRLGRAFPRHHWAALSGPDQGRRSPTGWIFLHDPEAA